MGLFDKLFGQSKGAPHCHFCAKEGHYREMILVGRVMIDTRKWDKPWTPTQNCFQCGKCGILACWTHSDSRKPCECGAIAWIEKIYLQKELDNG